MFEQFNYDYFMQSMLANVPDDLDKREGSVIWDALAPVALELETAYMFLLDMFNQSFGDTADREFLILRAHERGLIPKEATYAVLKGEFTPTTLTIPAGTRFNLGELNYQVGDAIEGEAGSYQMICETPGECGHKNLGNLIPIDYVEGLETANATEVLIPGEDEEDTEDFRDRYFNSFNSHAYGGNVQDYIDKVSALDGVGAVRVTPVWNGGRTVKVTILDSTYSKAGATLISAVQEEIDPTQDGSGVGIAPIDHVVTVDTPIEVTIDVSVSVELDTGYTWESVKTAVEEAIEAYLLELRTDWKNYPTGTATIVRISQIESRLLALSGIVDIADTEINGETENYTVSGNNIPILGVVTNANS